jgi:hypothetical protein
MNRSDDTCRTSVDLAYLSSLTTTSKHVAVMTSAPFMVLAGAHPPSGGVVMFASAEKAHGGCLLAISDGDGHHVSINPESTVQDCPCQRNGSRLRSQRASLGRKLMVHVGDACACCVEKLGGGLDSSDWVGDPYH